ncbi:Sorting nexin-29 [Tritrichomonas musculus]|uniref:Sorting nexin-29 n=1 Tax=Tritrichomonas musculus TaxID=1915356 RepID=A0ABR2K3A1_9EUKA
MLRIPLTSLPLKKQKLLAESPLQTPTFISIEGHHYDKSVSAVIYEIQVGFQCGHDVITENIKARFSDFERLDKVIRPILDKYNYTCPFPPKRWFGNTEESFICEREESLRTYIATTLKSPEVNHSKEFLSFFHLTK